jgi:hypothetical protein
MDRQDCRAYSRPAHVSLWIVKRVGAGLGDASGCQSGELLDSGMWIGIDGSLMAGPVGVRSWSAGGSGGGEAAGKLPRYPPRSPG